MCLNISVWTVFVKSPAIRGIWAAFEQHGKSLVQGFGVRIGDSLPDHFNLFRLGLGHSCQSA